MGIYLNPGNTGFQEILQSEYVDKTGLIALINKTVGTMGEVDLHQQTETFWQVLCGKGAVCIL